MGMDAENFFREVTKCICGSLDLQQALENCHRYLETVLPIDDLLLNIFDPSQVTLRRIAYVGNAWPWNQEEVVYLPAEVGRIISEGGHKDRLVLDTSRDPISRAVGPYVLNERMSLIILVLKTEGEQVGHLVMRARGVNRYTHEHFRLMASVREPLAIALANGVRHMEMAELKDRLVQDNTLLKEQVSRFSDTTIVGRNRGLRSVMEQVAQVAPLATTVLVLGETGTGKEVIANAIHASSKRNNGPLIKVNCGAIPENLIDSELFGHEKGAFTGAVARKFGHFERAAGGTVFLDEIGELPPPAQIRLLRVLQHREIERIGGQKPIPVDLRIIAATHRNLETMVQKGAFREDLWFRLNAFPIFVPPLRSRRDDIPRLLDYFIEKKSRELGLRTPPPIAPGALDELLDYPWPGNVREMENVVERALIQSKGRNLTQDSFTLSQKPNGPLKALGDQCGCVFPCLALKGSADKIDDTAILTLDEAMTRHIRTTLEKCDGKIHGPGGAAELLGLNPSTLRNRMKKLGIAHGRRAARATASS